MIEAKHEFICQHGVWLRLDWWYVDLEPLLLQFTRSPP